MQWCIACEVLGRQRTYSSLTPSLGWLWWRRNCKRSRVILDSGDGTVENLVLNILRFCVGYPGSVVQWTFENLRNWQILALPEGGIAGCCLAFPLSAPPSHSSLLSTPQSICSLHGKMSKIYCKIYNIVCCIFKGGYVSICALCIKNFWEDWQNPLIVGVVIGAGGEGI